MILFLGLLFEKELSCSDTYTLYLEELLYDRSFRSLASFCKIASPLLLINELNINIPSLSSISEYLSPFEKNSSLYFSPSMAFKLKGSIFIYHLLTNIS